MVILATVAAIGGAVLTVHQWRQQKGKTPAMFVGLGTLLFVLIAISNL